MKTSSRVLASTNKRFHIDQHCTLERVATCLRCHTPWSPHATFQLPNQKIGDMIQYIPTLGHSTETLRILGSNLFNCQARKAILEHSYKVSHSPRPVGINNRNCMVMNLEMKHSFKISTRVDLK